LLGAFQLREFRREMVDAPEGPRWGEKLFHDAVMRGGNMPIELMRTLFKGEELGIRKKAMWRFGG
jgi:uncharacterized protein (DUF885 family)